MSEKTIERNLGLDAYVLIKEALRGLHEKKKFTWIGSPNYLPLNHEYSILGFCREKRFWGFFEVRDETTQEIRNVFYDFLPSFKEILADSEQESAQTSLKCISSVNSDGPKGTYAGFAPLGGALKR